MNTKIKNFIIYLNSLFTIFLLYFLGRVILFPSEGPPIDLIVLGYSLPIILIILMFFNKPIDNKSTISNVSISLFVVYIILIISFIFYMSVAYKVAIMADSERLCSFSTSYNACIRDLAILRADPSLCEKTTASFNCYSEIAANTNNPALCKNSGPLEDYCLTKVNNS